MVLPVLGLSAKRHKKEKKCSLRYALMRGVEFFPMGKEEREGAAQGGFLLLGLFKSKPA